MALTCTGKIKGSAGGKARAILSRLEAVNKYYLKPNICLNCSNIIHIRDSEKPSFTRTKKFCSRSCATIYNNSKRIYPIKEVIEKEKYTKPITILDNTKGYYKSKYNNWWNARIPIAKSARLVYLRSDKPKECLVCGYNKHIEICHIKAVNEFDDNTTLREVNNIDNLIALCRNHHWEFDNNIITI